MRTLLHAWLLTCLCTTAGLCQNLYAPGGAANIQSATANAGIGTAAPQALFHIQQSASGWADGLRLSLSGKDWNILSGNNGNRLIFGLGTAPVMELNSNGTTQTVQVKADVILKEKIIYFSGDASDPNYSIQSTGWGDGMYYKPCTTTTRPATAYKRCRPKALGLLRNNR